MEKEKICNKIWRLTHDQIIMNLRFLDVAANTVRPKARDDIPGLCLFEGRINYSPSFVIKRFQTESSYISRAHLHMLFHMIFQHPFKYQKRNMPNWDLACDMACESTIIGLGIKDFSIRKDDLRKQIIDDYIMAHGVLTAARVYRNLENGKYNPDNIEYIRELFKIDTHEENWFANEALEISLDFLKKISETAKAELKSFAQGKTGNDEILDQLTEATKEKYDYSAFLKKFCVSGEEMTIDPDEFDYVYYSYGLSLYGNVPLIEDLEYRDINKIKEFVIAIDTSGSTRGKLVQTFLNKTYNILKSSENFFNKVNIHILQCDSEVQSDTRITCDDDFEAFMKQGRLAGFGSTDFRPVFEYVNKQIENGEFENLKGLIYFTDGFGVFPVDKPDYETAFVFIESEYDAPTTPPWAIKLVLEEDSI